MFIGIYDNTNVGRSHWATVSRIQSSEEAHGLASLRNLLFRGATIKDLSSTGRMIMMLLAVDGEI